MLRLQRVFQTKEKGFTTELAALQEANYDVEGAIIKEKKEATARIDNMVCLTIFTHCILICG